MTTLLCSHTPLVNSNHNRINLRSHCFTSVQSYIYLLTCEINFGILLYWTIRVGTIYSTDQSNRE